MIAGWSKVRNAMLALALSGALLAMPAAGADGRQSAPQAGQLQVSAGEAHTCALLDDGTAKCWGSNAYGQLGTGAAGDPQLTPVVVGGDTPLAGIVAISAGRYHTCAALGDGTARCWGANTWGQLGDGTGNDRAAPITVGSTTPLTQVVAISAGRDHTCAALSSGQARCWGSNASGQLGDGSTALNSLPVIVGGTSPLTQVVSIGAGGLHSCAALSTGTARCWGANANGQLGDGTTTGSLQPVTVGGGTPLPTIVAVDVGAAHSCARLSGGTARCWGSNSWGQLGDSGSGNSPLPVTVGGGTALTGITAISAGELHSCAALSSGQARCWGYNGIGQLGNGTTNLTTSIVVVGGEAPLTGATGISAGTAHSCAALSGGVRCWGNNASGRLGDGTTSPSSLPVSVDMYDNQPYFIPFLPN